MHGDYVDNNCNHVRLTLLLESSVLLPKGVTCLHFLLPKRLTVTKYQIGESHFLGLSGNTTNSPPKKRLSLDLFDYGTVEVMLETSGAERVVNFKWINNVPRLF